MVDSVMRSVLSVILLSGHLIVCPVVHRLVVAEIIGRAAALNVVTLLGGRLLAGLIDAGGVSAIRLRSIFADSFADVSSMQGSCAVENLLDLAEEPLTLTSMLVLQHRLYVAVPLQQALGVEVPLLDMLLAATLDPLQQSLQLGLLLDAELGLSPGEHHRLLLLHVSPLLLLRLVGQLLQLLRYRVVLVPRIHVLLSSLIQQLSRPLRRLRC